MSKLETKRFVIRKSLIGKNTIITFVNKKQEKVSYIMMKCIMHIKKDLIVWIVLRNISHTLTQIVYQVSVVTYKQLLSKSYSKFLVKAS